MENMKEYNYGKYEGNPGLQAEREGGNLTRMRTRTQFLGWPPVSKGAKIKLSSLWDFLTRVSGMYLLAMAKNKYHGPPRL